MNTIDHKVVNSNVSIGDANIDIGNEDDTYYDAKNDQTMKT